MPSSLQVPAEIVRKWQEIVDLVAAIMNVPSTMVMRAEAPNIKVFVSNRSEYRAALRWLTRPAPDLGEVREALRHVLHHHPFAPFLFSRLGVP
jgi:hypothetical protein